MSYPSIETRILPDCAYIVPRCAGRVTGNTPAVVLTEHVPGVSLEEAEGRAQAYLDDIRKQKAETKRAAQEQKAKQDAINKVVQSLDNYKALARATSVFLEDARELLVLGKTATSYRQGLATFARDLRGLADEYGLRIVKVGDGTWATLVRK